MAKVEEQSSTRQIVNKISAFIGRHREVFLVVLIVLAVGIVGFVVGSEIMRGRIDESTRLAEEMQKTYDNFLIADEEAKDELAAEILASANAIITTYPRLYASQRALFVAGGLQYEREVYDESIDHYEDLADRFPTSHLASIALFNAAVASEVSGDNGRAAEFYERIVDEHGTDAIETPHALVSLGRLAESEARYSRAAEYYRQVQEDYPTGSWTNVARARILSLTSQGLLTGE